MARGHIRQRGDRWELRVYAGTDPLTGRERRITRTVGGTRKAAERALTALLREVDERAVATGPDVTMRELCARWQDHRARAWSPKTALETERMVRRHIDPALGRLPIGDVTPAVLDQFFDQLLAGGRNRPALAPATVHRIRGVVHAALEQAVRWDWISRNPAARTEPIEGGSAEIVPPAGADLQRLLAHLADHDPDVATFVRLAAVTGRRRGELCALRWSDLDVDRRELVVSRTLAKGRDGWVERPISKNKTRFPAIALDEQTVDDLGRLRLSLRERLLMLGLALPVDGHLFLRPRARDGALLPWSPDAATRRFQRACAAAGLSGIRLHDLRHFVATTLIDQGVSLTTIGSRLGHGSGGRTTQAVYGHRVAATDEVAARVMADVLDVRDGQG